MRSSSILFAISIAVVGFISLFFFIDCENPSFNPFSTAVPTVGPTGGPTSAPTAAPTIDPANAAFLAEFGNVQSNVDSKAGSSTDIIVSGDIGGECHKVTTMDLMTMTITIVYTYGSYNDIGTDWNGTLTQVLDLSGNGTFTGRVDATVASIGYIEFHITFIASTPSGYYIVNGQQINI